MKKRSSEEWKKGFKAPVGSFVLINDCFGIGCSTEDYLSMIDDYMCLNKNKP